ncbi:MAG: tRNA (adenosine(37)-N6)-threonylcarbamoyltransferase complex dimerization subunit type 1 TsaB [Acidaminococcaceae bacterium]
MLVLGIDTATIVCAVGLCKDGKPLAEYQINIGMTHSEGLLPQLEQLLVRTGITKNEVDLIAVSMGPGSFTGLRIGLATAEALAYSWQIPLTGVSTLKALAYNVPVANVVLAPVLDAQKGNYYLAIYEWIAGVLTVHQEVQVVSKAELGERLGAFNRQTLILGECTKISQEELPAQVELAALSLRMPQAVSVALLALQQATPQQDKEFFGLEPYYIRRSEAEELWEKRQQ